jgi:hypothetical protein
VTTDAYLFVNKTYAVPSNVLLNWRGALRRGLRGACAPRRLRGLHPLPRYTNPVDCEDGYASRLCIPLASVECGWPGIFGNVAIFATNNLQLVQDPATKEWRVDQGPLAAERAEPQS